MRLKDLPGVVADIFTGIPSMMERAARVKFTEQSSPEYIGRSNLDEQKLELGYTRALVLVRALGYAALTWFLTK